MQFTIYKLKVNHSRQRVPNPSVYHKDPLYCLSPLPLFSNFVQPTPLPPAVVAFFLADCMLFCLLILWT